jgi:hypothetical protein
MASYPRLLLINTTTATGYGMGGHRIGVRFPAGEIDFSLFQTGSGPHPTSYPVGTGGSLPGGQGQGREADLSPPSTDDGKNT